jgi:hypothetical protein
MIIDDETKTKNNCKVDIVEFLSKLADKDIIPKFNDLQFYCKGHSNFLDEIQRLLNDGVVKQIISHNGNTYIYLVNKRGQKVHFIEKLLSNNEYAMEEIFEPIQPQPNQPEPIIENDNNITNTEIKPTPSNKQPQTSIKAPKSKAKVLKPTLSNEHPQTDTMLKPAVSNKHPQISNKSPRTILKPKLQKKTSSKTTLKNKHNKSKTRSNTQVNIKKTLQKLQVVSKPFSELKSGDDFEVEYINVFDNQNINCIVNGLKIKLHISHLLTETTIEWLDLQLNKEKVATKKDQIKSLFNYVIDGYKARTGIKYKLKGSGADDKSPLLLGRKRNIKKWRYEKKMTRQICLPEALYYAFFRKENELCGSAFKLKWNVNWELQLVKLKKEFNVSVIEGPLQPCYNCVLIYNVGFDKHATGFKNGQPDPNSLYYEKEKDSYKNYYLITI